MISSRTIDRHKASKNKFEDEDDFERETKWNRSSQNRKSSRDANTKGNNSKNPLKTRKETNVRHFGDTRDFRDSRDVRDSRNLRESRDVRDTRNLRESRDVRDTRNFRDSRDARDTREVNRKSVTFRDLTEEFNPDYSLYEDRSKSRSKSRSRPRMRGSNVLSEYDQNQDESSDFVDIDEGDEGHTIPRKNNKIDIRSSHFSATKDKTMPGTNFRRTEVNRLRDSDKISPSKKNDRSNSRQRKSSTLVNYNARDVFKAPITGKTYSKISSKTVSSKDPELEALAQKFKKYAQLEYEESKLRNKLCSYKNFNIDTAFKMLK